MAHISRLFLSEIVAAKKASAGHVNAEFNQLVSNANLHDDRIAQNETDIANHQVFIDNLEAGVEVYEKKTASFTFADDAKDVVVIENNTADVVITLPDPSTFDDGFVRRIINRDSSAKGTYSVSITSSYFLDFGGTNLYMERGDEVIIRVMEDDLGNPKWGIQHQSEHHPGTLQWDASGAASVVLADRIRGAYVPSAVVATNVITLPVLTLADVGKVYTVASASGYVQRVDADGNDRIVLPEVGEQTQVYVRKSGYGEVVTMTLLATAMASGAGGYRWLVVSENYELTQCVTHTFYPATTITRSGTSGAYSGYIRCDVGGIAADYAIPLHYPSTYWSSGQYAADYHRVAVDDSQKGRVCLVLEAGTSDTNGFAPFYINVPSWAGWAEVIVVYQNQNAATVNVHSISVTFHRHDWSAERFTE